MMTFMTLDEAKAACEPQRTAWEDADAMLTDAWYDLESAKNSYDDAGGFLDDATFWDVAAGTTAVVACLSNPFSWVVCGLGILGGGAGVAASEIGRQQDIADAEAALKAAQHHLDVVEALWTKSFDAATSCMLHYMSKASRP